MVSRLQEIIQGIFGKKQVLPKIGESEKRRGGEDSRERYIQLNPFYYFVVVNGIVGSAGDNQLAELSPNCPQTTKRIDKQSGDRKKEAEETKRVSIPHN